MKPDRAQNIFNSGASTVEHWKPIWIVNAAENYAPIKRLRTQGKLRDISLAPKVFHKMAIVIGSGPTLDQYTDATPEDRATLHEKYVTFASTSNANVLRAAGYDPTYVVIVDSNKVVADHICVLRPEHTTLVTTPCVEPKVLRKWKGDVLLFKPIQTGDDFIINILPKMYSDRIEWVPKWGTARETFFSDMIKLGFLNVGCTPNASIEVANYLGYDPIHLLGVDYAYVDGRSRARMFRNSDLTPVPEPGIVHLSEHVIYHNGEITNEEMAVYKSNLLLLYYLGYPHLTVIGEKGGISTDELPHISWQGLIKHDYDEIASLNLPIEIMRSTAQKLLHDNFNTDVTENPDGSYGIKRVMTVKPPAPPAKIDWQQKYNELLGKAAERERHLSEVIGTLMTKLDMKETSHGKDK